MNTVIPSAQRLFFALWPDEQVRTGLAALRRPYLAEGRGRAIDAENLHMTLVFLGGISPAQRTCVADNAGKIKTASFSLDIDAVCAWRHNHILWAGVSPPPASLLYLVKELRRTARACGIKIEKRAWQPHITLARDYPQGPAIPVKHEAFRWQVKAFALVESLRREGRTVYEVRHTWPLHES